MTYRQLRDSLGTLDEIQLDTPVRWVTEGSKNEVESLWILPEPYVDCGEGMEPASVYKGQKPEDGDEDVSLVVYPKGTVILLGK